VWVAAFSDRFSPKRSTVFDHKSNLVCDAIVRALMRAGRDRVGSIRFDLFVDDTRKLQQGSGVGCSWQGRHYIHVTDVTSVMPACKHPSLSPDDNCSPQRLPDAVIYSSSVRR